MLRNLVHEFLNRHTPIRIVKLEDSNRWSILKTELNGLDLQNSQRKKRKFVNISSSEPCFTHTENIRVAIK